MTMRSFGQVPLELWIDPHFAKMSDQAKLALLYIWSGPHSETAGVMRLPDRYATADLQWTLEQWEKAREEVREAGFIERDSDTQEIFNRECLKTFAPTNQATKNAMMNQISRIRSDELRSLAESAYDDCIARSRSAKDKEAVQPSAAIDANPLMQRLAKRQAATWDNNR